MRHAAAILLTLSALTLSGCGSSYDQEEAAVYAAYVNAHQLHNLSGKRFSQVVILDHTTGWNLRTDIEKAASRLEVPRAVVDNWKQRNDPNFSTLSPGFPEGSYTISALLHFAIPHTFISEQTRSQIFANGGWDEFFRRYPNSRGFVGFSRVGFHWSRAMAMLYVFDAGEDAGMIFIYVGSGISWKEVTDTVVWIS